MIKTLGGFAILTILAVAVAAAYGWIMNIATLVRWAGDVTAEFLIRVVGIFIPVIGSVMGYL